LAVRGEGAGEQRPDHLRAKDRDALGGVLGRQLRALLHEQIHPVSFRRKRLRDVEWIDLTARVRRTGAGSGGLGGGGARALIGIAHRGWQNAAPKKASQGTEPVASGACAATNAATRAARSRIVPSSAGPTPKSASAQRVQRRSAAQRVAGVASHCLAACVRARSRSA